MAEDASPESEQQHEPPTPDTPSDSDMTTSPFPEPTVEEILLGDESPAREIRLDLDQ